MAVRTGQDMMSELAAFGERYWAGEAEVARTYFAARHEPQDHVPWLRHQCYRELRGPGLLKRPHSRTDWVIENVKSGMPALRACRRRRSKKFCRVIAVPRRVKKTA